MSWRERITVTPAFLRSREHLAAHGHTARDDQSPHVRIDGNVLDVVTVAHDQHDTPRGLQAQAPQHGRRLRRRHHQHVILHRGVGFSRSDHALKRLHDISQCRPHFTGAFQIAAGGKELVHELDRAEQTEAAVVFVDHR